jgi:hypothetical protein
MVRTEVLKFYEQYEDKEAEEEFKELLEEANEEQRN